MKSAPALLLVLLLQTVQAQPQRTPQIQQTNTRIAREKRGVFDILPNRHVSGQEEEKDRNKLIKNKFQAQMVENTKIQTQLKSGFTTIVQNYFSKKLENLKIYENQNQVNLKKTMTKIVTKKFVLQKLCRHSFGTICRIFNTNK